jgi:hypothetical protein
MNFKELRRGMIVVANTFDRLNPGREMSYAKASVQKAMMWSGTFLSHSGLGDNPYVELEGKRKNIEDIEPMFDSTEDTFPEVVIRGGQISCIDTIRAYLSEQIDALMLYNKNEMQEVEKNLTPTEYVHVHLCLSNIYTNLVESRMWLGMELGRIRDAAKA